MAELIQMKEDNFNKEQRGGQLPKLTKHKLEARLKTGARGTITIIKGISTKREIYPQMLKMFPI